MNYGISSESESEDDFAPVKQAEEETGDKIEKVLDSRDGPVGLTGNQTILYNDTAQSQRDANATPTRDEPTERQYLIKWTNWSNLHNTWESHESLKALNCSGMRKLENFIKRHDEVRILQK